MAQGKITHEFLQFTILIGKEYPCRSASPGPTSVPSGQHLGWASGASGSRHRSGRGIPGRGCASRLFLWVIKMELKINSLLQPDCISRDKLSAMAFVNVFLPKLNWILFSEVGKVRILGLTQHPKIPWEGSRWFCLGSGCSAHTVEQLESVLETQ